jgi:hypothetical protein
MVKYSSSYTDSISLIKSDKGIPHRKIKKWFNINKNIITEIRVKTSRSFRYSKEEITGFSIYEDEENLGIDTH